MWGKNFKHSCTNYFISIGFSENLWNLDNVKLHQQENAIVKLHQWYRTIQIFSTIDCVKHRCTKMYTINFTPPPLWLDKSPGYARKHAFKFVNRSDHQKREAISPETNGLPSVCEGKNEKGSNFVKHRDYRSARGWYLMSRFFPRDRVPPPQKRIPRWSWGGAVSSETFDLRRDARSRAISAAGAGEPNYLEMRLRE